MKRLLSEELYTERKKQGLTVESLAKLCGVSRSYITLIENNKRMPGKKTIPLIAKALNLKTAVVLNWYLEDIRAKLSG